MSKHLYAVFEKIRSVPGLNFFIHVLYWFLRLFFLFIFSLFRVFLKTVLVIQMASVVHEVLVIGSGLMKWAVSAAGVTSVICMVSISEWFRC